MGAALEIDLLRTFTAIAETGGFTRASEKVGRTQAAVSQQMQRLEGLVGFALFARARGGPPVLTPKGAYFLERARELVALNDDILLSIKTVPLDGLKLGTRRTGERSASLVVLPFQNGSGSPSQDHLARGIGGAVLGALSRMKWLRIVAGDSGVDMTSVRYSLSGYVVRDRG